MQGTSYRPPGCMQGPFAEGKNDFFNTPLLKEIGTKRAEQAQQ